MHRAAKRPARPAPPRTARAKPRKSEARGQTFDELRELQRLTFAAVRYPLSPARRLQNTWIDGRPMREVLSEFIKPNDRLTSSDRVEIYSKSYWFRVLDCLYDDYPGLLAILGENKFHRLRVAYLNRYPSQSFTLRNLGARLSQFLTEEPHLTSPASKWPWTWPALNGPKSRLSTDRPFPL